MMRVARNQATEALDAVRRRHRRARARSRVRGPHARQVPRGAGRAPWAPLHDVDPRTVDRALGLIDRLPPVRGEVVAAASARMAAGERPSAVAIADMAVRRAACDLLR